MRDLLRTPFSIAESQAEGVLGKGPVVYQELVNRPEENVVVQLVLAKNEIVVPLHVGDMLRSFPEPAQLSSVAVQNSAQTGFANRLPRPACFIQHVCIG